MSTSAFMYVDIISYPVAYYMLAGHYWTRRQSASSSQLGWADSTNILYVLLLKQLYEIICLNIVEIWCTRWKHALIILYKINLITLITFTTLSLNLIGLVWKVNLKYPGSSQSICCHINFATRMNSKKLTHLIDPGHARTINVTQSKSEYVQIYFMLNIVRYMKPTALWCQAFTQANTVNYYQL